MALLRAVWRPSLLQGSRVIPASFRRAFSLSMEDVSKKMFELRTYNIVPKDYLAFLKLTKEKIHLRLQVSTCVGYWCTDLGGLNEVVHIWMYDDFAHRTDVRKRLAGDQEWLSQYAHIALPMVERQDNAIMYPVSWWTPTINPKNSEPGLYELVVSNLKPGSISRYARCFQQCLGELEAIDPPLGIWHSNVGPLDTLYSLHRYANGDNRRNIHEKVMRNPVLKAAQEDLIELVQFQQSKLLTPAAWSPSQ